MNVSDSWCWPGYLCTSLGSEVKFSNNSYVKFAELRIESQQCNTTTHQLQTQLWTCEGAVANATHHRQQQEAIREQEEAIRQQEEAIRNNKAPRILAGSDRDIFEGDNVELIATATDPEGDHLTIQWELVHGPTALSGVPFIGPQLKLSNMPVGTFNFQASTSDSFNKSASASVTVNVRPSTVSVSISEQPFRAFLTRRTPSPELCLQSQSLERFAPCLANWLVGIKNDAARGDHFERNTWKNWTQQCKINIKRCRLV